MKRISLAEARAIARQAFEDAEKRKQEIRENDPDSKCLCLCECCQKCCE